MVCFSIVNVELRLHFLSFLNIKQEVVGVVAQPHLVVVLRVMLMVHVWHVIVVHITAIKRNVLVSLDILWHFLFPAHCSIFIVNCIYTFIEPARRSGCRPRVRLHAAIEIVIHEIIPEYKWWLLTSRLIGQIRCLV